MRSRLRPGRRPSKLTRTLTIAAIASLPLAALPASAAAAQQQNSPPSRPLTTELSAGGADCVSGPERPLVAPPPELHAVIRDPDAVPPLAVDVTVQHELSWKDAGGATQRRRIAETGTVVERGTPFRTPVADLPRHTVIDWRVRAHDGTEWGPWSSSGGQGSCRFVLDDERPEAPTVSSREYPDDATWHEGVGDYGHFTFHSPSSDTTAYRYTFMGEVERTVAAPEPGAPATVSWVPETEGRRHVSVEAIDGAGNPSVPTDHDFLVGDGRTPAGHWKLADAAGAGEAAAEAGTPARAGAGVTFGAEGPSGTDLTGAAALDGTTDAHLTPDVSVVDTTKPFAFAAWVRPDTLDRDMTAVGQHSEAAGTVALGLSTGTGAAAWSFSLPTDSGPVHVRGGHPVAGEWTHLGGVYDPVERTAELFVNGSSVAETEGVTAQATGALQIGRTGPGAGPSDNWHGRLAGVRVWDRLVFEDALAALAHREAVRTGYWQLNEAADGRSPEYAGGQDLVLGGDAQVPPPNCAPDDIFCTPEALVGTSSLELDGAGDHAVTGQPVIDSGGGFTLAARVRFDSDPARDMTVLSLPGEHTNALVLRYAADTHRWELAVTASDDPAAEVTTVGHWADPTGGQGEHLAVTYDASTGTLKLYVNGQPTVNTVVEEGLWSASGGLQIGRSLTSDGWGEHLAGAVDEVRSYTGVATGTQIARMNFPTEDPDL